MFDKFHLTIKTKECQLTSTFSSKISPQCHMPSSTCHSNFLKCQLMCGFFVHESHYMSNSKLYVSFYVHFFVCKFYMSNIKNLQKLCQKYALTVAYVWGDLMLVIHVLIETI